jgi:hypothetical protein
MGHLYAAVSIKIPAAGTETPVIETGNPVFELPPQIKAISLPVLGCAEIRQCPEITG